MTNVLSYPNLTVLSFKLNNYLMLVIWDNVLSYQVKLWWQERRKWEAVMIVKHTRRIKHNFCLLFKVSTLQVFTLKFRTVKVCYIWKQKYRGSYQCKRVISRSFSKLFFLCYFACKLSFLTNTLPLGIHISAVCVFGCLPPQVLNWCTSNCSRWKQ